MGLGETFIGKKCNRCKNKERYVRTRICVSCAESGNNKIVEYAKKVAANRRAAAKPTFEDCVTKKKPWPTVRTADNSKVKVDPIALMTGQF